MNRTYQPSGKISILFVPAAAAMLVITAAAALLCTFGIQASPATLLDMTIYLTITKCIAGLGSFLCVRGARVRKPAFAKAAGVVFAVWYWLLLIGLYTPIKAVLTAEKSIWVWEWDGAWKEALERLARDFSGGVGGGTGVKGVSWMNPAAWKPLLEMLAEPVLSLKSTGAAITGKSGNTLFTLPGIVCVVLLVIVFFAAAWQFGYGFWRQGRAPFCEASGKWAKETVIELRCQDEEAFLSRLLLGDTTVLAELEPLGGGEADCYFKVSVFAADWSLPLYVSVSKMTKVKKGRAQHSGSRCEDKPKRRKKPVFEEEQLAEYLAVDRGTGCSLLSRSSMKTA